MEYRLNKQQLLEILRQWSRFLKRKVHLIACGGTAMTLFDVKASTKDVDFMVPVKTEYPYLIKMIKNIGYEQVTGSGWRRKTEAFQFDLFQGNRIHTTEILESPLIEGHHWPLVEFSRLYLGVLNEYDLISSKLIRGSGVDFDDCLMLVKARREQIDIARLIVHYRGLAGYDIAEARVAGNIDRFIDLLREEKLYD